MSPRAGSNATADTDAQLSLFANNAYLSDRFRLQQMPLFALGDGGARLEMNTRLYEQVRAYQQPELQNEWGRFWR